MAASKKNEHSHPDHKAQISRLRRIKGQVEGVEKMIEARRYCPEIITQIRAASAALKSLEASILERHLRHCVADALESKNTTEQNKKIAELLDLFKRS